MAAAPPWRALRFDVPAGYRDDTVLTLLDEQGGAVVTSLTIVGGPPLTGPLEAHVDQQVEETSKAIAGYRVTRRAARQVASMPAVVVEARATPKDAGPIQQLQAYISGADQLFIITATSADAHAARGKAAFEKLLADLRRA